MKLLLISFVAFAIVASIAASPDDEWEAFKKLHKKRFASPTEEKARKQQFIKHLTDIKRHNKLYRQGKVTYRRMINKFADMSASQVFAGYNGFKSSLAPPNTVKRKRVGFRARVPDSLDWRDRGVSTPVKDQQNCRSCWAFSAVGAMESQEIIHNNRNITLSEQNLIDCANSTYGMGCYGGHMEYAFNYTRKNGGLSLQMYYDYEGFKGECRYKPVFNAGTYVMKHKRLPIGDEAALKEAVGSVGPIAASIDATHESLIQYYEGIYYEEDCKSDTDSLTHAVLIVGYGTENGHDYWLIKNSMGKYWGEKGYFRIARNKNNHCGIATDALYPILKYHSSHRVV